jgi:glyoxylase-like metal-dependent hydrolase (beta-lactamase superfamily II)
MKIKIFFSFSVCILSCVVLSAQGVFRNDEVTISKLDKNTWVMETFDMTTMYILEGTERAMLIDTGTKCEGLDEIVRKITQKPLIVVVTHNHPDHAGNIRYFDEVYMHPADSVIHLGIPFEGEFIWMKEGDIFDLGERKLEVYLMPGHTPGSVILVDRSINAAFSSDAFGSGQIWMQLKPHVPMTEYYASCIRMEKLMNEQNLTKLYVGHYPFLKRALGLNYVIEMKYLAKRLSEGDTSGAEDYPKMGMDLCDKPMVVKNGEAMIVFDSENIN